MNRLLKWLLTLVGIVAVIVVVIAVVLPRVIDPNNYKEEIRTRVFEQTGRELTIGGDIEWSIFPSVALEFKELSLSNRAGFGDQPMLTIGEARVSVELIPLFSRQVKVGQVSLGGVSAYLRENVNGQNNWEDLAGAHTPSADKLAAGSGVEAVSEILISNGSVTLNNTSRGLDMQKFDGYPAVGEPGQPFGMSGEFSVEFLQKKVLGEVRFEAFVQPASNMKWFGAEDIDVSFNGGQGAGETSVPVDMTANANAVIDLAGDRAKLFDVVIRYFDIEINGDVDVTSLAGDPVYAGDLKMAEFSPKELMKSLGMDVPHTAQENALTKMQGDMKVTRSSGSFNIQSLRAKLDKSTFNGSFSVEGDDDPQLAFDLLIDQLNLDDYAVVANDQTGAGTADPALAFAVFFILPGGGDLRIGQLVSSGLTITDINVKTQADSSALRLFPISANLYGGQQQGDVRIDISGDRPTLTSSQTLTGIQIEGLLRDLAGEERLQGTGDFYMQIQTDLTNSNTVRQEMSGDMGLSIIDGALVGVDVGKTLESVASALGGQNQSSIGQDEKTEFTEFIVTGLINNGIFRSDDLMMRSPVLTATGTGTINLVNETIDYLLKPTLVGGTGIGKLDQLSGKPIPVRITGNLSDPNFSVDVVAGLTDSQNEKLSEKKDELANKLLEKVFGNKKKANKKDDGGMN